MLQDELKILQALGAGFNPCHGTGLPEELPASPLTRDHIDRECGRVTDAMTSAVFAPVGDQVIERYIQHHQTSIINLADQLQQYHAEYTQAGNVYSSTVELLGYFTPGYFSSSITSSAISRNILMRKRKYRKHTGYLS